jgi:hypothetical protein
MFFSIQKSRGLLPEHEKKSPEGPQSDLDSIDQTRITEPFNLSLQQALQVLRGRRKG